MKLLTRDEWGASYDVNRRPAMNLPVAKAFIALPTVTTPADDAGMAKMFCTIDGCDKHVKGHGLCETHYMRKRRHGSPTTVLRVVTVGPPETRFWSHVDKTGDCWLWTASVFKDRYGYGKFNAASEKPTRVVYAHRFSWELANGPIPDGLWVLHHCDNPPCVRPDHLFLGTQSANVADMHSKGRGDSWGWRKGNRS